MSKTIDQKIIAESFQLANERGYWLQKLAGELVTSHFPYDFGLNNAEIREYGKISYKFPEPLANQLIKISNGSDFNLYMVLVAGINALLAKYTGNQDIVIGAPIYKQAVEGEFINTALALRNQVKGEMVFKELLVQVKQTLNEANDNLNYPIWRLLEQLNVTPTAPGGTLLDVVAMLENIQERNYLQNIRFKTLFTFTRNGNELSGTVEYDKGLYRAETIKRIIRHYERFFTVCFAQTGSPLAELEVSTEEEQELRQGVNLTHRDFASEWIGLINESTATGGELASPVRDLLSSTGKLAGQAGVSFCRLFERQVAKDPERIAIVSAGGRMTYWELNARANQLACYLRASGVQKDSIVALLTEPCAEMVVGILAIFKAGAAYLAIDQELPPERMAYMLEDSRAKLVLTTRKVPEEIASVTNIIDLTDAMLFPGDDSNLNEASTGCDLAYIIYTSGTTGAPKGVMLEQGGLCNYATWFAEETGLTANDSTVLLSSYAFDLGYTAIYPALISGCALHLITKSLYADPRQLLEYIAEQGITYIKTTPTLFNMLVQFYGFEEDAYLKSLRWVILGGESLQLNDVARFHALYPETKVMNHYGPTEATVGSIFHIFDFERFATYEKAPVIGKPIANAQVYLLDRWQKQATFGVPGEIYLAGAGLARGYLNQAELTAERFIENPLGEGRLYRTGDLGKYLPDGNIMFLGRIDQQVKIRGYRIELGEIENALLKHPEVKEALVLALDNADGSKYLSAYYIADGEIPANELKDFLLKSLPAYMIPVYFILLDRFPMTANGKIDRKALPLPELVANTEFVAPENEIESKLVTIWSEVLNLEQISVTQNFFDLGGNSLNATSIVSRIHQEFQVELPLGVLFSGPTIKELARHIENHEESIYDAIHRTEEREYYPVSSGQKRLYITNQMEPLSTKYNIPVMSVLEGQLDRERLEMVFQKLIQRHESLRTSFELVEGVPVQRIHNEVEFAVQDLTLSESCKNKTIEEIERIVKSEFIRPFDLCQAPLIRVGLAQVSENLWILAYDLHHIIFDGISLGILHREFARLYAGEELPELRIQYRDFAVWQNNLFKTDIMQQQEKYWLNKLNGMAYTEFLRKNSIHTDEEALTRREYVIDENVTKRIEEFCMKNKVTKFTFITAVFKLVLSRTLGQADTTTGISIMGRVNSELENLIGLFLNVLMIRTIVDENWTFSEYLNSVKETVMEVQQNQDYPYEELFAKMKEVYQIPGSSLFSILMNFMPLRDKEEIHLENLTLRDNDSKMLEVKFGLVLFVSEGVNQIFLQSAYKSGLYDQEMIEGLVDTLGKAIAFVIDHADAPLRELHWHEADNSEFATAFNRQELAEVTAHGLLERINLVVARTPERIALEWGKQQMSYGELDIRARALQQFFFGGEEKARKVCIFLDRSPELITSILGVIRAGATFVPLDPKYPEERLCYILEDVQSDWVISSEKYLPTLQRIAGKAGMNLTVVALERAGEQTRDDAIFYPNLRVVNYCFVDPEVLAQVAAAQSSLEPGILDCASLQDKSSDNPRLNPEFYIFYTSGSTGRPKGIVGRHDSLVHFIDWEINEFGIDEDVRVSQLTSPAFDASLRDIFLPLCVGGALCIPENDEIVLQPERLSAWIAEKCLTLVHMVPSVFKQLTSGIQPGQTFPQLRYILMAGEMLRGNDIREFREVCADDVELVNLYGATETTLTKLCYRVKPEDVDRITIPVGQPISHTQVMILDAYGNSCETGHIGEVYIRTPFMTAGYYRQPEMTAKAFLPNPFTAEPNDLIYRTGDLGRKLPDGNFELLGRIDQQVKIRGVRIEPGEIEAHLLQFEGMREAVVTARKDATDSAYLCAYYVADVEISSITIRQFLLQSLPEYMIPQYFIQLNAMPLTPNGKINRAALPEPEVQGELNLKLVAPEDEIEARLMAIWHGVLDVEHFGTTDDFFVLGGHSIKAISIIARIFKEFKVEMPLREFFEQPTIRGLAQYIRNAATSTYAEMTPIETREYYPLSSAQKRMYIVHKLDALSLGYNMTRMVFMEGSVDMERFRVALEKLVARHESLRTSFIMVENEPVQIVHPEVEVEFAYREITDAEAPALVREFIRPFDLSVAPLFRTALVKLGENFSVVFDMHHIISDLISMNIIIEDFFRIYAGETLPELKVQYKDFAVWQNQYLTSERVRKQEKYWVERFNGEIPVLELPVDFLRPSVHSFEGGRVRFALGKEQTASLRDLAARSGATLSMAVLAIYNIILARYSGQDDIVIGMPAAGRGHENLSRVVGMFVNTLAMRNFPAGDKTFEKFLGEVRENALNAFENQDYQFEMLVEKLNLRRDMSRNPLFDVILNYNNVRTNQVVNDSAQQGIIPTKIEGMATKFDLTLWAVENPDGILFTIDYWNRLFHERTIEQMAKHFLKIVEEVTGQPELKVGEIDLLSESEKAELLYHFQGEDVALPEGKTVGQWFEEQVEKTPHQTAIIFGDTHWTYRELNERANQFAYLLVRAGVTPGTIVALLMDRSLDLVAGVLGIIKAGGAYLPLDPVYPEERLRFMLQDSQAFLLLTQRRFALETPLAEKIIFADDAETFAAEKGNLNVGTGMRDPIYVIYTSGSTGKPKGVILEHRAIINFAVAMLRIVDLTPGRRMLSLTTVAFDVFVMDTLVPLMLGLTLIFADEEEQRNPVRFNALALKHKGEIICSTPSRLELMMSEPEHLGGLGQVQDIWFAGEILPPNLLQRLRNVTRGRIFNMYGPTETTVVSTGIDVTEAAEITIGRPIANTQIYILDSAQRLVPVSVIGEICLGGEGLARGYLNRDSLTEERFIPSPFVAGERIYRSGDLGRWLPDGRIDFAGRVDDQVKIRGFRIEPGEIEAQLLEYPGVKEAVVMARHDQEGSVYLTAYMVADEQISPTEIRQFLLQRLPDYMVPQYFMQIPAKELTANGKIDRNALPEPAKSRETGLEYVAPVDEIEAGLVRIWSELLGVERVGTQDDFFLLGGHSLKATAMASRIQKEFHVTLPLREIFKAPTIQKLAACIRRADKQLYAGISPAEEREYYPLSSAQQRMFIIHQMLPNSTTYNIPRIIEIEGDLNLDRFEGAMRALIARHESFRTSFSVVDNEPVQKVHQEVEFAVDYREGESGEINAWIREFIKPFDLSRAPLLRVGLLKTDTKYFAFFDMHHIISDLVSMNIVVKDFASLYAGEVLPELRIQYKDFAVWQKQSLNMDKIAAEGEYWRQRFAGEIPVLQLPEDLPRPGIHTSEGRQVFFQLESKWADELLQLATEHGATMSMALLAAYNILLAKYSGQEDIVVGMPVTSRPHEDLNQIVGVFINTLALRNYPTGHKSFRQFLNEVKEDTLNAFENQDYPFELLVDELKLRRNLNRSPLFDVLFNLNNVGSNLPATETTENLQFKPWSMGEMQVKYDLNLAADTVADGIRFTLGYWTRIFRQETVERLARHLLQIIKAVVLEPDKPIAAIEFLSEEEKEIVLNSFNATQLDYPREKTLAGLWEEQVARTPEERAVVFGEDSLTYRELNERANCLARLLRAKGVGPDRVCGLLVERSLDIMVGILGVLKAGGAYLPLDPSYPGERLQYMLQDSEAVLLLTQHRTGDKVQFPGEVVYLDEEIYTGDTSNLELLGDARNLAYVIYTSGSTGRPKGVMIEQQSVHNFIAGMAQVVDYTPGKVMASLTTISFDIFVLESIVPLSLGLTVVIANEGEQLLPNLFNAMLLRNKVDMVQATPSRMGLLLSDPDHLIGIAQVKDILIGTEVFPATLLKRLKELTNARIYNLYGPTETTVYSAIDQLTETDEITIGRPLANTRLYILDQSLRPLPTRVVGEVYIAGEGVARGYWKQEELTHERFLADPFVAGQRMYRTGDLGRWLEDGRMEFISRVDQQIKIRGYRIEPGEIETCLKKVSGLISAVVISRTDHLQSAYLSAYFVAERPIGGEELRTELAQSLPEYMIPQFFVQLDTLPLTPNGKIDRRALPAPQDYLVTRHEHAAPTDAIEAKLVEIWQEILDLPKIGIDDEFFELGGNSLKVSLLIARSLKEFGVELPLRAVFETPTIRRLAAFIRDPKAAIRLRSEANRVEEAQCIVRLNEGRAKKNLFVIHGLDGSTHYFQRFASYLGNVCNVYGIQAPGLHGEAVVKTRAEMVEMYLEEIKRIQKDGPYLLGGYCAGTRLVYDLTVRLEEEGMEVENVIFFDPDPFIQMKLLSPVNMSIQRFFEKLLPQRQHCDINSDALREHLKKTVIQGYRPVRILRSPISIILASEGKQTKISQKYWNSLSTGTVHTLLTPGDHNTLFGEDHAARLAEVLTACIVSK